MAYTDSNWFPNGNVGGQTIVEQDTVQISKVLGPDGQPYAIRRPKMRLGFDLTPTKS